MSEAWRFRRKLTAEQQADVWLLDFAGKETRGTPYIGHADRIFCPHCLVEIVGQPGFGLAYGGYGTYWVCEESGCGWFFKVMEKFDD